MIEIVKADEGSNILEFLWSRPFGNPFEFGRVHSYYAVFNYHAKEINFFFVKGAFGGFEEEMFLFHGFEDDTSAAMMSLDIRGEDENIIHVYYHPSFIYLILKDMVHI